MNTLPNDVKQFCIQNSAHIQGPFVVKAQQQEKQLELLRATCEFERFFFVVNLKDSTIKHGYGINRWLGYPDTLSMKDYIRIQHPATVEMLASYGFALIDKLTKGELPVKFVQVKFSAVHAMRKLTGDYSLVKRVSSPFQFNHRHEMTEYLNEFTIIRPYRGEAFEGRGFNIPMNKLDDMKVFVKKRMYNLLPFSPQEFILLQIHAFFPKLSEQEVSLKLNPKKPPKSSTIKELRRRIKAKAEQYFTLEFRDIHHIAAFLKEEDLL